MRLLLSTLLVLSACAPVTDEGTTVRECTDGQDNDGDGLTDCDDPGCEGYDECAGGGGGSSSYQLTINEFMASNASTVQDETGAWPDWVEIYNWGDEAVELDGFTITDDLSKPDKDTLSGLSIDAGGYLLLFADGDTDQGDDHLSFNLARVGESLGLYDPDGAPLTELNYDEQATDWSAARVPDGSGDFVITEDPTPGASNGER